MPPLPAPMTAPSAPGGFRRRTATRSPWRSACAVSLRQDLPGDTPELTATNLFYRRPDLYDQVQADPDHAVARQVTQAADEHVPHARTLLDLGCGTGRDLASLSNRFDCVGVEIQPDLAAHATRVHPRLDVRVADMRHFRLGHAVDIVTCLGNSLAYLHDDHDLAAAFTTFSTHATPGTLLIISTLTEPVTTAPRTHRIETADLQAAVTMSYDWDEHTKINTMRRAWRLDDGTSHDDLIPRRVISTTDLQRHASAQGFQPVECGRLDGWIKRGH